MCISRMLLPVLGACLFVSGGGSLLAQDPTPFGVWRGESKCMTDAPACHDEQVVYTIEPIPGDATQVTVRADKIVDGKSITMGVGPWTYDSKLQALSFEPNHRLWDLRMHGDHIEGTLTMPDHVVFRRMTLTRDRAKSQ